jgi:hypothetical protein
MTFNYKTGLFRIWLVLTLLWIAAAVWAGVTASMAIGLPVGFGIVLCLIVWAIRGFGVKPRTSSQTFDLNELRRNLAAAQSDNLDIYQNELEPYLSSLGSKYGTNVPISEMEGLQQFVSAKLAGVESRKREIIERGAQEGKTIEIDALRRRLEATRATYTGPDRDGYGVELDRLLGSLAEKYGTRIPVDHAYRIMQDLQAGRGLTR